MTGIVLFRSYVPPLPPEGGGGRKVWRRLDEDSGSLGSFSRISLGDMPPDASLEGSWLDGLRVLNEGSSRWELTLSPLFLPLEGF